MEVIQAVNTRQGIPSRPHVQGSRSPLRLRGSLQSLTDGAGLVVLRRLWDRLDLGRWLDARTASVPGRFRPSLMVELWVALVWFGGGWLDDLDLLASRRIRRLFGWVSVPDPTTFGRWLRRAAETLVPVLDELLWQLVRIRWSSRRVPRALTVAMDSTVCVRYGKKQAGAELGYNPKKPGRPSHHPLLAFIVESGDLIGVRWRAGSAHASTGAAAWLRTLVGRLRELGIEQITVRLDKGFFSKDMVEALQELKVGFLLKVPNYRWLQDHQAPWRKSVRAQGIFPEAEEVWSTSGTLWDARLLSLQGRRPLRQREGMLELDTFEAIESAHILTNLPGIHCLTAWRRYNAGTVVEQRIEELGQLSLGQTAIDDLGGNALLWALGGLAYQLLHLLRGLLPGSWRRAQPKRLRAWLFRLPGKFTHSARQSRLQVPSEALTGGLLARALTALDRLRAPPEALAY